jgi:hypothetical protein
MTYDYTIIGAGPAGLTLAYTLGKLGKKCLLIDENDDIGGCHRVIRVNGLFTEHGPRVYSLAYINTINILCDMGIYFKDIFVPYDFSASSLTATAITMFNIREILLLGIEFMALFINSCHGKDIAVGTFMKNKCFSEKAIDYTDRLCRFTDGMGADRYTLYEFLSLINQQLTYKLYHPVLPNDIGLFKIWREAIEKTGNVTIKLSTKITDVSPYLINKTILAIPPASMMKLLTTSTGDNIKNAFGEYSMVNEWSINSDYNTTISIIFHWKNKIGATPIWGFPKYEWAVAWIELSNYMDFKDDRSLTVFSACVTKLNTKSNTNGKTANECDEEELIKEIFNQIRKSYEPYILPPADFSIINPRMYQSTENPKQWKDADTAFAIVGNKDLKYASDNIKGLYNVGTQNGNSEYIFTSFESAVNNAIGILHVLEPKSCNKFPRYKLKTVVSYVKIVLYICLIMYLIIYIYHKFLYKH